MFNKLLEHIKRYIFYDIVFFIILLIIVKVLLNLFHDINENNKLKNDYSYFEASVLLYYQHYPEIVNDEGRAVITMTNLMESGIGGEHMIPKTKEMDECMGYFIVEKINDNISVDYTHICDMMDY